MMSVDLEKLTEPFPREAIKQRPGRGNTKFDYVPTQTVIRRLNNATQNNWSLTVDRIWEQGPDDKGNGVAFALVTLSLPGMGSRQHMGVQAFNLGGGEDLRAKGAISDALKKAATLFGLGLELYGDDDEAIAADREERRTTQPQMTAATQADVPPDAPASDEMRDQLKTLMEQHGWTGDDFRHWRAANKANGWSSLTVRQAGMLAADIKTGRKPGATKAAAPAATPASGAVDLDELERDMAAAATGGGR